MKIFISYSSDDSDIAERIALSIRNRGHKVFLDRHNLSPGISHEKAIEVQLGQSQAFIFLISKHSIAPGRFTLTELMLAQERWPSPSGIVLPVLIDETDIKSVPNYLRSVTILEPHGDIPAEVASAVGKMKRGSSFYWLSQKTLSFVGVFALMIGILAGILVWRSNTPRLEISVAEPNSTGFGILGRAQQFSTSVEVKNTGLVDLTDVRPRLEVIDENGAREKIGTTSVDVAQTLKAGEQLSTVFRTDQDNVFGKNWRACVSAAALRDVCTRPEAWEPSENDQPYIELPSGKGSLVAAFDVWEEEVAALLNNGLVLKMDMEGNNQIEREIGGTPISVSFGKLGLFVGTTNPNAIVSLNPSNLDEIARIELSHPNNVYGEPVSNTPAIVVQDEMRVWSLTRGSADANGLLYFPEDLTAQSVPEFYDDIAFDLPGLKPAAFKNGLVSADSNSSPSSVRVWDDERLRVFSGHSFEIASCAHGLASDGNRLFIPDCDGTLWEVDVQNLNKNGADESRLEKIQRLGEITGYAWEQGPWPEMSFAVGDENSIFTAIAQERSSVWGGTSQDLIIGKHVDGISLPLMTVENANVENLEFSDNILWALLTDKNNTSELIGIKTDKHE